MYTIKLSDGTLISGVELNGTTWYVSAKLTAENFAGKLKKITITGVTPEDTFEVGDHENMRLQSLDYVQGIAGLKDGTYFTFRKIPASELAIMKVQADNEYIAMMSDIDLEG